MKKIIALFVFCTVLFSAFSSLFVSADAISPAAWVVDFEKNDLGDVADNGGGIFDADSWGKCSEKKIVGDDKNKMFYYEKDSAERAAGFFSKTFETSYLLSEGYSVKFKAKSDFARKKVLKLMDSSENEIINMEFGTYENSKINGTTYDLTGNADGEFHSYEFIITSDNKLTFLFDETKVIENQPMVGEYNLSKIQVTVQGNRTENNIYIDDFVVCSLSSPAPNKVKITYADNKVSLLADDGCSIYYTLNLAYPDSNAELYAQPIDVMQQIFVKAVAINSEGVSGICAIGGPYEYIAPPDPFDNEITPFLSDKMYVVDFEDKSEGNISPNVVFDADYGLCHERLFVKENDNMSAKISKQLSSIATDAWLQHTFDDVNTYETNFVIEFSAKQTVERSKLLRLTDETGSFYFNFSFGEKDKGGINGVNTDLKNNLDGNFHHYKFVFKDNGVLDFYYDGTKIDGDFSYPIGKTLKSYRFSVGGVVTEGDINTLWIDNIVFYELAKPVPSMPKVSKKSGNVNHGTQITLSADDDCAIYYTLDGTVPLFKPEYRYEEPIEITTDGLNIKAIAVRENGNYSACTVSGKYFIINENSIVRLTENPFSCSRASEVEGAEISLFSLENNKPIKVVIALYKGEKLLLNGIEIKDVLLTKGLNEGITLTISKNTQATKAAIYIWEEKDGMFYPITNFWELVSENN